MGAAITGWGVALPSRELRNDELAETLPVTAKWISDRTGIEMRRVAGPEDSASSLATTAGREALARAGVEADELDMVIVATSTPDYQLPATAPLVQAALGAGNAGAFDTNAACSGFLYGLAQADGLIASGTARKILFCASDLLSRVSDYTDPSSCVLFGDGAGAVVIERVEGTSRLGPFVLRSDGSAAGLLHIPSDDPYLRMEGREVYRHAVDGMTRSVNEIVERAGMKLDEIDLVVAHQANARIVEAVGQRLGLRPDQVALNIARLGNTSAASIPLALAQASHEGDLEDGDHVIITAFGAGFVWGAALVRWGAPVDDQNELVLAGEIGV
ncbi:MAG: ketoacyl-ACP synthase III [Actinomycetota bacterium]|nr:ketoacyl-ACP synthase III [Actinomycetota bacterium]